MGYTFVIGSFNTNLLNYNNNSKIDNIASIIAGEHYDVIALQEVCREEALSELCGKLPGSWKFSYSYPPEKYGRAFVWNADRLHTISEPTDRTGYHVANGHIRLKRPPHYGRFTPDGLGGPAIEIRLINLHLEPSEKNIAESEYKTLAEDIYPTFSYSFEIDDTFYMPAYTISMGDYNLTAKKCNTLSDNKLFLTVQNHPTTVSNIFDWYTLHDYDHLSYNKESIEGNDDRKGFGVQIERVDAVNKYFESDYAFYRKCVSDHVPIKFMLSF